MLAISKEADLNRLVQGGQLYWSFPFSKDSLYQPTNLSKLFKGYPFECCGSYYSKKFGNILDSFKFKKFQNHTGRAMPKDKKVNGQA